MFANLDFSSVGVIDFGTQARQAAWREASVKKLRKRRQLRLERLRLEHVAIDRATEALHEIDTRLVPTIAFKSDFVRLEESRGLWVERHRSERTRLSAAELGRRQRLEVASRPPVGRLAHRDSRAMALYLTAIFAAQVEGKPGKAFDNKRNNVMRSRAGLKPWVTMAGLSTPAQGPARAARVRRGIDELVKAGLARIHPSTAHYRYEHWLLLSDTGSEGRYVVPGDRSENSIHLSANFFLNGWHLVLEPTEIQMLLAILEKSRRLGYQAGQLMNGKEGVAIPESTRVDYYGISGEAYLAAQQLHEFGLVTMHDYMPNRRKGKLRPYVPPPPPEPVDADPDAAERKKPEQPPKEPYYWTPPPPEAFDRSALAVVQDTLTAFETPYRLDDNSELVPVEVLRSLYLEAKGRSPK